MTKPTYNSIDVAKLIGAFLVVAIHANPFSGVASTVAISLIARMAVPFFFMVSAFFFFRSGCDGEKLKVYLKRMGRLYLIWFIVGLPIVIKRSFIDHPGGFSADLLILIRNFFLGSTFRGSWFIMGLMIAIPLVYLMGKRLTTGWIVAIGVFVYIPLTLLSNYYDYLPIGLQQFSDWTTEHLGALQCSFLIAIVFCAIGKYLAEREVSIRKIPSWKIDIGLFICIASAAAEVLLHTAHSDDFYFMLVPVTTVLLISLFHHEIKRPANYSFMRNQSTVTYFAQFTFINLLDDILGFRMGTFTFYFLVLLLCFLSTIVMRWIAKKKYFTWVRYSF